MHRSEMRPRQIPWYYTLVLVTLLTVVLAACSTPANDEADTTAPTVVETTPSDGATAPTNEPVSATFDEAIDVSTLTTSSFVLTGPGATLVGGAVTYEAATSTAVYTPTLALDADTAYTATLSTDVTDLAGNALDGSVSWSFTTGTVSDSRSAVELGTAGDFVILAKAGVSTTVGSDVTGDLGVSPIDLSGVTGFDTTVDASGTFATSAMVTGEIFAADLAPPTPSKMTTAISDMETAYTDAAGRTMPDATELGAGSLGGLTLDAGLYTWSTGVLVTGSDLTLSGSATDVWILQIAEDLTLANGISVTLAGDAQPQNVFWQVAGQATIGTDSVLHGTVLSKTAIILETGATLHGYALAQTAITLDAATVTKPVF